MGFSREGNRESSIENFQRHRRRGDVRGGGSSAWAQTAAGSNETVGVDDIVVTATRREESANKIPVAIQALGSKQLEQLNVTNFEKLVEYLPAVRTASRYHAVRDASSGTFRSSPDAQRIEPRKASLRFPTSSRNSSTSAPK